MDETECWERIKVQLSKLNLNFGILNLKMKEMKNIKLYLHGVKVKQDFLNRLDGEIKLLYRLGDELQEFRDKYELKLTKEEYVKIAETRIKS